MTLPVFVGRDNPTPVGSTITFRFLDRTDLGSQTFTAYLYSSMGQLREDSKH